MLRLVASIALALLASSQTLAQAPCALPSPISATYVDLSLKQLQKSLPILKGVRPDPDDSAQQTESILDQTSQNISTLLSTIPNLIAEEVIHQQPNSWHAVTSYTLNRSPETHFNYRLIPHLNSRQPIQEFRTDTKNRPLPNYLDNPGIQSPFNVGFAALWLLFSPDNLSGSHFVLLGRQKVDKHDTNVLTFAEMPSRSRLAVIVGPAPENCSTFLQGIVWIDRSTSQIVRLQTDLLSPLPFLHLNQLRSTLDYSEVHIAQRGLTLWLPSQVITNWSTRNQDGGELHSYSKYRLFAASSTIVIPAAQSSQ